MFLDHLRPAVALVTLCLIFVQGRAHQAQQLPATPPVAQASLARTAPVLDSRVLHDPAWQGVPTPRRILLNRPRPRTAVLRKDGGTYCVHGVGDLLRPRLLDRDPSGLTTSDSRRDSPLDDRLQQANTGVFIVYTDSHRLGESPFRPSNADRSFIVKTSRMFDALR
jgi:hypothetical protein